MAIDTDTGALILGDRARHIEELRCANGRFLTDKLTLTLPTQGWVIGLDYLGGAGRYLPDGPSGCPQADGTWPCSFVNSRPAQGNSAFAFTLDTMATSSVLLIGFENLLFGDQLLPFDLTPLGAPGCWLGTSAHVSLLAAGANPSINVPLPGHAVTAYTQWAVLDSANPLGIVLSEARRLVVH